MSLLVIVMYEIIEKQQEPFDSAHGKPGQWRIRAIVSAEESMFLWFGVEPDQANIDWAIDSQLRQRVLDNPTVETTSLSCSPWQFRKALNINGLRALVENAVAESNNQDIKDGWNYATVFNRYDLLVISFSTQLGKTDAEMDSLFELARTL